MRKPKRRHGEPTDLEKANYKHWYRLRTLRLTQITLCHIAADLNCQNLLPAIHTIIDLLESATNTDYEFAKVINKQTHTHLGEADENQ